MSTHPLRYKMGKLPAREDAIKYQFANYFSTPDLPTPPKVFGVWQHFWNIGNFQNDKIGDCVMAGAANETAAWHHDAGKWVKFTDAGVVSDYAVLSGYRPDGPVVKGQNTTDTGLDVGQAAEYRRTTGIIDHNGIRHKVDAYVKLKKGDLDSLITGMWLFGAVGIGIECPDYFLKQFAAGEPWSVKKYRKKIGGHYIPGVGMDADGNIVCISWGQYQRMTPDFYQTFSDEACGYFTVERLLNRTSPEGFLAEVLIEDLKKLKQPWSLGSFIENLLDKPQEV